MPLESPYRNHRIEFIREVAGVTPTDPAWLLFSDSVQDMGSASAAVIHDMMKVGSVDVIGFERGVDDASFRIVYYLQRWIVDGPGNPLDASGDGMQRSADNETPSPHTIVVRRSDATGGADAGGKRIYTVCEGAEPNTVTIEGEPGSGEPVKVTIDYLATKIRSYEIDQPAASGTITVESTDATDTTQTVTVEDEGAGTSEGVALNGTTPVASASSFADIDAALLSAQTKGDVIIKKGANTLLTIEGKDSYDGVEGDLGTPLLGSGSHASAIGGAYEKFLGDTVERPGGTSLDDNIASISLTVNNNIEAEATHNTFKKRLSAGRRVVQVKANVFSDRASPKALNEQLTLTANDIVWTMTGGTITAVGAVMKDSGGRKTTLGQAIAQQGETFESKGLTVST